MSVGFEPTPTAPFNRVLSLQTFSLFTLGRRASQYTSQPISYSCRNMI